jgi:hypothetical protein
LGAGRGAGTVLVGGLVVGGAAVVVVVVGGEVVVVCLGNASSHTRSSWAMGSVFGLAEV